MASESISAVFAGVVFGGSSVSDMSLPLSSLSSSETPS
ncbi:hypothetical protein PR003_g21931 [Phytophthora rubi]|uniref:Uncharacterized protein n=1 Tax=Phytophthora rubi TaxID=129364 RepID=A0A6A4D875_9STRA|nr:hypothetical protein PR003_g21931 [Phytophthora rubi]